LKEYNCPKHYLGNSARSKRRHKQIGRELQAKGYRSIKEWFSKRKETPDEAAQDSDTGDNEGSDDGGSLNDHMDDQDLQSIDLVRLE